MWDKIDILKSCDKNVMKYVFSNESAVAESVLYKYGSYEERTVICCSTQSGCPVGCRFCGAGDGFVRSLSANEIISQVFKLLNDTSVKVEDMKRLQIMFMSMGEPLLNVKNLIVAMGILYTMYPNAALLVSTIGPKTTLWDSFLEACVHIKTIGLQFSIHESTDERRDKLIPFVGKMNLSEISHMGSEFHRLTGRQPFINYCVHGENNTDSDADRLFLLFDPAIWQATLSVICERDEGIAAANVRQRTLATDFETLLRRRGYSTRTFDPAGQDDIGGGCGQLWFVQDWMKQHEGLVKSSVGRGLPVIHTPK